MLSRNFSFPQGCILKLYIVGVHSVGSKNCIVDQAVSEFIVSFFVRKMSAMNPEASAPDAQLKLQLDHDTRDSLKLILFNFSSVLNGKVLSLREQKELLERNKRLLLKLSRIPRFFREPPETEVKPNVSPKRRSPRKTRDSLELPYSMRNELIDMLYRNQDCAILYDEHFPEPFKRNLVAMNNQLVARLDDLRNRPIEKGRRFLHYARLTSSLTSSSEGNLFCYYFVNFHDCLSLITKSKQLSLIS